MVIKRKLVEPSPIERASDNAHDVISNHQDHTGHRPQDHKHEKRHVAKRRLVFVVVLDFQLLCNDVLAGKRQSRGNHVLEPNSGESPRDAHQHLDVRSGKCDGQRRQYGYRGEEKEIDYKRERLVAEPRFDDYSCKSLQVLSQRYGTDGKVGGQCEYGIEDDVIPQYGEYSVANGIAQLKQLEKVDRVDTVEFVRGEERDSRVRKEQVEAENEAKVAENHPDNPTLG